MEEWWFAICDADSVSRLSLKSWYRPQVRGFAYQVALAAMLTFLGWYLLDNLLDNMRRQGIASGFAFLSSTSGFSIIMHLIPFEEASSYGRAFTVGLLNTLFVSILAIVMASIIGFLAGIARLSKNYLLAKMAAVFVELMRNIPLLLILFFFYFGILRNLPEPNESFHIGPGMYLCNRGLYLPFWSRSAEGLWHWSIPVFEGFDFSGGVVLIPEFVALVLSLSFYTAGFIAEIVRAGILAVSRGQREAAYSLGLTGAQTLRLVIIPQAMRVILPPLASQYLNLVKNSTLAAAIGFPDLVQVFAGTVLSQTGQAVEIISVTMAVYLSVCLAISFLMNRYNQRSLLREQGA